MKKLLLAAALALPLGAADCPRVNTASSVVVAAANVEVDRAYRDFGALLDRVEAKHLTPGSPLAKRVAADIRNAKLALHNSDVSGYRAAEARINGELK